MAKIQDIIPKIEKPKKFAILKMPDGKESKLGIIEPTEGPKMIDI